MTTPNPKGEFIWRMLGSILSSFVREFGVETMKTMVLFFAENEDFWEGASFGEKMEEKLGTLQPWKRGAHDFIEKMDDKNTK